MNWQNPFKLLFANIKVLTSGFEIVEITPGLYQSSAITKGGTRKIKELGIDVVIDLEGDFDLNAQGLLKMYIYWPIVDGPDLPDETCLYDLSRLASNQMLLHKILTHCSFGNNRSGLINALILMQRGLSGEKAVKMIQSKRPSALSNNVFREWIEKQ